jgi:hypothetical protein
MQITDALQLSKKIAGYKFTAFGFTDSSFTKFGVTVFAARDLGSDIESWESLVEPEYYETIGLPTNIQIDQHEFPVIIRRVSEYLHNPANPQNGTGACYGKSKVSSRPLGPGILTAKHVVGSTIGTTIHLSCSCIGKVVDVAPDGIDAALVESPCSSQYSIRLNPMKHVAPWMDVTICTNTISILTKIVAITDTRGIFNSAILPVRIFLAASARPGDSGALVSEQSTGEPVGIYMGEIMDASGQIGGIAQHAYQVAQIMDMELYK